MINLETLNITCTPGTLELFLQKGIFNARAMTYKEITPAIEQRVGMTLDRALEKIIHKAATDIAAEAKKKG